MCRDACGGRRTSRRNSDRLACPPDRSLPNGSPLPCRPRFTASARGARLPPSGAPVKNFIAAFSAADCASGLMRLKSRFAGPLSGRARPPGDKSISHRALILGALAEGTTTVDGLLEADDVLHTAEAARSFGAGLERGADGRWTIAGAGGFRRPAETIDCGNSGTAARLLIGAASAYPISARFDGDQSLRKRPMNRIVAPLTQMGARFDSAKGTLPMVAHGGKLKGVTYR